LGYAAKRWAPRQSLAVLFAAALFADLLWPVLAALRIEHGRIAPGITASTPLEFISYSHSLLTLTLLGALFGWLVSTFAQRSAVPQPNAPVAPTAPIPPAVIVLALVVSHWLLDVVTHIPDMPLYPGGPAVGLGLWNSVPGTIAAETVLFALGVWIYAHATKARDATGMWALAGVDSVPVRRLCHQC